MIYPPDFIRRLARESVTQPVSVPVTSNSTTYFDRVGEHKLGWRAFRREIVYRLSGQDRYRVERIRQGFRRGLWMYFGVPQIGDSLMDLAPRSLFDEAGVTVDLITHEHLAHLYRHDPWFGAVYSDFSEIDIGAYDFVIVPSNKYRSLNLKRKFLPHHLWLSMHGRFTGPDFHRAEFATRRIADFLALTPSPESFAWHARPKLGNDVEDLGGFEILDLRPDTIALALGGVDQRRTYLRWPEVVRHLRNAGLCNIVLLGSDNGLDAARQIMEQEGASGRIHDLVGKTSLSACRKVLSRCALAIAADGGLMHLAIAGQVPVISLFHSDEQPRSLWFLPASEIARAIHSATRDVSDIEPQQIAELARNHLGRAKALSSRPA